MRLLFLLPIILATAAQAQTAKKWRFVAPEGFRSYFLKPVPVKQDNTAVYIDKRYYESLEILPRKKKAGPTASLPIPLTKKSKAEQHVIFWDSAPDNMKLAAAWKKQAHDVASRLRAAEVPEANIHLIPAPDSDAYFSALERIKGRKHVYVFGHSNSLYMQFGLTSVDVESDPEHLLDQDVQSVCHFGCLFASFDADQVAVLQGAMKEDGSFLVSGHFGLSTRADDNIRDDNPNKMQVIQISPEKIDTLDFNEMEKKIQGSDLFEHLFINN